MVDSDLEWSDLEWEDTVLVGLEDILEFNEENILPQPPETVEKIRAWLQPTDYCGEGSDYLKHLASHLRGTGQWFLSSDTYTKWLRGNEHGMLWVRGVPGSGKSVLAASIIRQLSQEQVPVLYFFFRQIIDANQGADAALRDWIAQVLPFSPPLQSQLLSYLATDVTSSDNSHAYARTLESFSTTDLWRHLRSALSHLRKVYIVVDALDEMKQGEETSIFLRSLASIAEWQPSQIKVLATSRATASVERALRREKILRLRLEESKIDVDIKAFVKSKLANSHIPPEFHQAIKAAVPGKANGLFLYAKLAMDAVLKLDTTDSRQFQSSIQDLPGNLNIMYSQLLREHADKAELPIEVQVLILQAATHCPRPMRLIEVADLIHAVFPTQIPDLKTAKGVVRSACGPLLEVLPDETLCVVHHSLTEFLIGDTRNGDDYPILEPGPTHQALALHCLTYLMSGCLAKVREPGSMNWTYPFGDTLTSDGSMLSPLTKYAAENWHVHVKKATSYGTGGGEIDAMLDQFTEHEDFSKWVTLAGLNYQDIVSPVSMAVALGLTDYLKTIISRPGTDINAGTPIPLAAEKGFLDMVNLLVEHGADISQRDFQGYTALHHAVKNNHAEIVSIILRARCDPSRPHESRDFRQGFGVDGSPFWHACHDGHTATVTKFLPYIESGKVISDAIFWAAKNRQAAVVKTLLQRSKFNSHELELGRALQEACSRSDLAVIQLLVAAGADLNGTHDGDSGYGINGINGIQPGLHALVPETALRRNVPFEVTKECFSLLINAGANVNQPDSASNTPLHLAGNPIIAELLLEAGANVAARNIWQETPLHTNNSPAVIRLLVESGKADIECTDYRRRTALLASLDKHPEPRYEVAFALIELGANVNAVDKDGNGSLHLALGRFRRDQRLPNLIDRLCAAGADVDLRNNKGEAPIYLIKLDLQSAIFQALMQAGARVEPQNDSDKDAIFKWICDTMFSATDDERPHVCETLAKAGLSIHFTDANGSFLLHAAIASQGQGGSRKGVASGRCIQFLIESGLDPQVTDNEGNTLWHEMALSGIASSSLGFDVESLEEVQALLKDPEQAIKLKNMPFEDATMTASARDSAWAIRPFDTLLRLGLDPTQPNHNDQTPLHYLSRIWPEAVCGFKRQSPNILGLGHTGKTTAFDFVLSLSSDVDYPDKDGITALHLASTFSEYQTRRLLEAGADPRKCTSEGCNALHVAARSRAANILGMLLESIHVQEESSAVNVVNGKDMYGRSPLFYACASGQYESVKLLIDAGAEVETLDYESSPWKAFATTEDEAKNWSASAQRLSDKYDAGGVMTEDKKRPVKHDTPQLSHRADELVALLLSKGPGAAKLIDQTIADAAKAQADSTVELLLRARQSLALGELQYTTETHASISRRQTSRANFGGVCENCNVIHERGPLEKIWTFNDYHLLPDVVPPEDRVTYAQDGGTLLHRLVGMGLATTLRHMVTLESVRKIEDPAWCLEQEASLIAKGCYKRLEVVPLLLEACRRSQPSMDIIHFLVEDVGVDIHAHHHDPHKPETTYEYTVQSESSLHALVRGGYWWQIGQALPYLLERGANTELRDSRGMTPLSAALERTGWLIFNKKAVYLLVQHGADVNAVDNAGISCLSKALFDREIVEILLNHGARISHDVLVNVIDVQDIVLLRWFLSRGADPNVRSSRQLPLSNTLDRVDPDAMYPLHRLLSKSEYDIGQGKRLIKHKEMIRLLLEYGADICAEYPGTTVLHSLINQGHSVTMALSTIKQPINLECRDYAGDTPLLLACHPASSAASSDVDAEGRTLIHWLIMNGADVRATADSGYTALHYLCQIDCSSSTKFRDLQLVVSTAPDLVHIRDRAGDTPLHLAMSTAEYCYRQVDLLLENQANVNLVNDKGETVLHLLLKSHQWKVNANGQVCGRTKDYFTRLLDMGLDINARNHAGETPVFNFVRDGGVERTWLGNRAEVDEGFAEERLRVFFTEAGVDWEVVNTKGQNLLHVVAGLSDEIIYTPKKQGRMFKALLDMGLDAGLEDEAQMTPLDVAAEAGSENILALFNKADGQGSK